MNDTIRHLYIDILKRGYEIRRFGDSVIYCNGAVDYTWRPDGFISIYDFLDKYSNV